MCSPVTLDLLCSLALWGVHSVLTLRAVYLLAKPDSTPISITALVIMALMYALTTIDLVLSAEDATSVHPPPPSPFPLGSLFLVSALESGAVVWRTWARQRSAVPLLFLLGCIVVAGLWVGDVQTSADGEALWAVAFPACILGTNAATAGLVLRHKGHDDRIVDMLLSGGLYCAVGLNLLCVMSSDWHILLSWSGALVQMTGIYATLAVIMTDVPESTWTSDEKGLMGA